MGNNSENNNFDNMLATALTSFAVVGIGKAIKFGFEKLVESKSYQKSIYDSVAFSQKIKEKTNLVEETREKRVELISKIERNQEKLYEMSLLPDDKKKSKMYKEEYNSLYSSTAKSVIQFIKLRKKEEEIRDELEAWVSADRQTDRFNSYNKIDRGRILMEIDNFECAYFDGMYDIKEWHELDEDCIAILFNYGAFKDDPRFDFSNEDEEEEDVEETSTSEETVDDNSNPEEIKDKEFEKYLELVKKVGYDSVILDAMNRATSFFRMSVPTYYADNNLPRFKVSHNAHIAGGKKEFCSLLENIYNEIAKDEFDKMEKEYKPIMIDPTKTDVVSLNCDKYTDMKVVGAFDNENPLLRYVVNINPEKDAFAFIVFDAEIAEITVSMFVYDFAEKKFIYTGNSQFDFVVNE